VSGRRIASKTLGAPIKAIAEVRSDSERAHEYLTDAWDKIVKRNPDPSGAYCDAIRAIEVVAKPVVLPNDSLATLGKIIRAIRDKPDKWRVVLDKATSTKVVDMADMVWKGQQDRHGTDEQAALNVSLAAADAAVYLAVALVRLFASGGFAQETSEADP